MQKTAASRDRHEAFVTGQENLTGVKEVTHNYKLKKDSDGEVVVTHSMRTDMIFDSEEEAKDAFLDVHDARDEAEFDETGEEMEKQEEKEKKEQEKSEEGEQPSETKEASYTVGMTVKAKYEVKAQDLLNNKVLVSDGTNTGWINKEFLNAVADYNGLALDVKNNAIIPDFGAAKPAETKPQAPINMAKPVDPQALESYTRENGYACVQDVPLPAGNPAILGQDPKQASTHDNMSLLEPNFPVSNMEQELKLGVNRELEHVSDPAKALEIAIDHVSEDPNYYNKLNTVLPESGPEHKPERKVEVANLDEYYPSNMQEAVEHFDFTAAYHQHALNKTASFAQVLDRVLSNMADFTPEKAVQAVKKLLSSNSGNHISDTEIDEALGLVSRKYNIPLPKAEQITKDRVNQGLQHENWVKDGVEVRDQADMDQSINPYGDSDSTKWASALYELTVKAYAETNYDTIELTDDYGENPVTYGVTWTGKVSPEEKETGLQKRLDDFEILSIVNEATGEEMDASFIAENEDYIEQKIAEDVLYGTNPYNSYK